ncbi:ciliary basal body-associated, B9 protein [Pseudoscourfieldia marina]
MSLTGWFSSSNTQSQDVSKSNNVSAAATNNKPVFSYTNSAAYGLSSELSADVIPEPPASGVGAALQNPTTLQPAVATGRPPLQPLTTSNTGNAMQLVPAAAASPHLPPTTEQYSVPSTPNLERTSMIPPTPASTHQHHQHHQQQQRQHANNYSSAVYNALLPAVHFAGTIATFQPTASSSPRMSVRVEYEIQLGDGWTLKQGNLKGSTHAGTPCAYNGPAPLCEQFEAALSTTLWQNWPHIAVHVYMHEPNVAREVFLGHGLASLPLTPGMHHIAVECWRPNKRKEKLSDDLMRIFTGFTPQLAKFGLAHNRSVLNAESNVQLQTVGVGRVHIDVMCMQRDMSRAKITAGRHLLSGVADGQAAKGDDDNQLGYADRDNFLAAKQSRLVQRELQPESDGLRSVREGRGAMRGVVGTGSLRSSAARVSRGGSGPPSTAGSSPRLGPGADRRSDRLELELAAIRERRRQRDTARRGGATALSTSSSSAISRTPLR